MLFVASVAIAATAACSTKSMSSSSGTLSESTLQRSVSIDSVWVIGPGHFAISFAAADDMNLQSGDTVTLSRIAKKGKK
jgi:hypothetical protein